MKKPTNDKPERSAPWRNEKDDGPGPGWPVFDLFVVWLDGLDYGLTREEMRNAYRSEDWRSAVRAIPQPPILPDMEPDDRADSVWGGYQGDDSRYCTVANANALNPQEEVAIMDREDQAGRTEYLGPWGEYPWKR